MKLQVRVFFSWLASVYMLSVGSATQAAEMALANSPLFLGTQVSPNIFFMLDDSGSMDWEILTQPYNYYSDYWKDQTTTTAGVTGLITTGYFRSFASEGTACTGTRNNAYIFDNSINTDNVYNSCLYAELPEHPEAVKRDWRVRSSTMNIMYYNPSATYSPWSGYSNANFFAARSNPEPGSSGYSLLTNLTGFAYDVAIDDHGFTGQFARGWVNVVDTPNGITDLYDSHTTYTVNSTSVTKNALTTKNAAWMKSNKKECTVEDAKAPLQYGICFGTTQVNSTISGASTDPYGRTVTEIQQNVANWYQYHRRRSFVAKAAIATVISTNDSFRFGISLLNDSDKLFYQVPAEGITEFEAHNTGLMNAMFEYDWGGNGTPLRRGLEMVGRYYSDYYSGTYTNPIVSSCQQNYSVLFTDGYWGGNEPYTAEIDDEDGDGYSDTLADVAHYFYSADLSPLPNNVPASAIDQNSAQHMVSFTVAFGVRGYLEDTDNNRYPDPALVESDIWGGNPATDDLAKIDDLWHAAFNSKGYFVSAQSTEGVANAIAEALLEIADRIGSAASVATNTGSLNAGSNLFQARFDSADWKGQLLAFEINLDGTISSTPSWEAGAKLNAQNYDSGRKIITWNPNIDNPIGGTVEGQGIPFRFPATYTAPSSSSEMNSSQINHLLTNAPYSSATVTPSEITANQAYGAAITNYLRGDTANEGVGQQFRNRNSVLGDIVNSDPKFVAAPNSRYPDNIQAVSYSSFVTANASRAGVVYAGANDGMLHAFSEATGNEVLAYVPGVVYRNLDELATPDYEHRYFVDSGPNILDVFFPSTGVSGAWKTMLAGGLGGGGQGIYALDVTSPSTFSEANASSIVLWEFDDSDDADLGYTYGRPQLAKMANGKWAAIFGNGYNNTESDGNASTTGHAVLFIVDVETGAVIKKIDTGAGSAGTPNGLATPLLVDQNGDFVVDYIYSGDLLGNMWKFNVTSASTSNWDVAYKTGPTPNPLFTTESQQAITSQPQAAFHPDNLPGFMIYFGTGKYLEVDDNDPVAQPTQAFYGIWDKNASTLTPFTSADLVTQTIDNQYSQSFDTNEDQIDDETFLLRDVSNNPINFASDMGWKLNLMPQKLEGTANTENFGEKQISNAIVRNGRIIFTTLIPSSVECEFGGTSFLMQLDFRSGAALKSPAFDLNNDGEYDSDDTDASGRASDVGIMPAISILANGAEDVAFGSGASGDIDVIQLNVGNAAYGRQSWRQLE